MSRFDPRPTGVKLRVLDTDTLNQRASEQLGSRHEVSFTPWAIAERGGTLYAVCSEGVGYTVTEADGLPLGLYARVPGTISIAPSYNVSLSPAEVRELATDEEIDLADLIRRFGGRLEANFRQWFDTLTAKVGA